MGLCQGRTCRRLVAQLLAATTGQPLETLAPAAYRPPLRAVSARELAAGFLPGAGPPDAPP